MSDNIYWYIPQHVLYMMPIASATVEKVQEDNKIMEQHLDETDATVHIIIDTSELRRIPISLARIKQVNTFFTRSNIGWLVVIEGGSFARFIARIMANLAPVRVKFVNNIAEAEKYLSIVDATINWEAKSGVNELQYTPHE